MFDSISQFLKVSDWSEESWSRSLMEDRNRSMTFSGIVSVVGFSGGPIVAKLALIQLVLEPVVLHVHCFQFHDIVVHHTQGSSVVGLHWCGWLFVA
jgi:hypothetical protein